MSRSSHSNRAHSTSYQPFGVIACVVLLAACAAPTDANLSADAGALPHPAAKSGDGGTDAQTTAEVGSSCTSASECASPGTSACLAELSPLAPLAASLDPFIVDFARIAFPGGYCSSMPNCANDTACDASGVCFRPFRDVTTSTLRELEPPLAVSEGSLDYLPSYGVCLRPCTSSSECMSGQVCDVPLSELLGLIPGSSNEATFCITDPTPAVPVPDREIGEACTADAQCDVPFTARCRSGSHPLTYAGVPPEIAAIGLDFPSGYCSSESCASDVECGTNGQCFAPFRGVTSSTLRDLEPPLGLSTGSLDSLPDYGVCLRACTGPLDCFPDQACGLVMTDLTSLIPDSENTRTYCSPHPDCAGCSAHAHCFVDMDGEGACVCDDGYVGNGAICTPN